MIRETVPLLGGSVQEIPLEQIQPGDNVRKTCDPDALADLAASIKDQGVLQPVIVVRDPQGPEGYRLVAGERRWRAAQLAGLQTIPAIVRDMTPEQVLQAMIVENLQREDVLPAEEAQGFRRLLDLTGWTQTQLAERIGKSQAHVANRLRLLKLPAEVLQNVNAGKLPVSHALHLLRLEDSPKFLVRVAHHLMQEELPAGRVPRAIDNFIYQAAKPLDNDQPWRDAPLFDRGECRGCAHAVRVVLWGNKEHLFCLKDPCWNKKQKAAQSEQERQRAERVREAEGQAGPEIRPQPAAAGAPILGQRDQVAEDRRGELLKKAGDPAAAASGAIDSLPLARDLRQAAMRLKDGEGMYASYHAIGFERECFLPLQTLLAHFNERRGLGATSMPAQMGALRIVIPEQGVDFRGNYGSGQDKNNFAWNGLAEIGVAISNAAGTVFDSEVSSADWVYYHVVIRGLTYATCYLKQIVIMKGQDRTILLEGSDSVTMRRDLKIKWLQMLNQLPAFPGADAPAGAGGAEGGDGKVQAGR